MESGGGKGGLLFQELFFIGKKRTTQSNNLQFFYTYFCQKFFTITIIFPSIMQWPQKQDHNSLLKQHPMF